MRLVLKCVSLFIIVGMVSCSKYEDGPAISVRSKKDRLTNTWKMNRAFEGGEVVTENYEQFMLQLLDGGYTKWVYIATFNDRTEEYETEGTWEFSDSKEELVLNMENDHLDQSFIILKLDKEHLWLLDESSDRELQLEPFTEE